MSLWHSRPWHGTGCRMVVSCLTGDAVSTRAREAQDLKHRYRLWWRQRVSRARPVSSRTVATQDVMPLMGPTLTAQQTAPTTRLWETRRRPGSAARPQQGWSGAYPQ